MGSGETLVRICDPAGRPRGTGFVADDRGTVVTGHEVIDGLAGAVLHAPCGRSCLAESDAMTLLPELGLALLRTDGLGGRPLPISTRETVRTGTYVRVAAHGWRQARVLGVAPVTYAAAGRSHQLDSALELAMGTEGSDALRPGGAAAGGPVVDATTGAVLGVLGTALRGAHPAAGLAVPLRGAALAPLLRRNAATVPGHGRDLNLAGVLELTALSVGSSGGPAARPEPVERAAVLRQLAEFTAGDSCLLGLVGDPGTGRTTVLRALAARRALGAEPAPTLWLRGADLRADDTSVADELTRTLRQAGRIVAAGETGSATPEQVARIAAGAGQSLLVLLDSPEEMPPPAQAPAVWTARTVRWLRAHGVQMIIGCRPEHWEQLPLPGTPRVSTGDLLPQEAAVARQRYGIPDGTLAAEDAVHPLTLRMFAEVRAALPGGVDGCPTREDVFTAYLSLMCLRIAVRIAAARGLAARTPAVRGSAVRRLAARVSGQVHEAARRCLGPGQGDLDRASFEELFPWHTGWAPAVLAEGLLAPAGPGYRFAHSELADWLQAEHLDLDGALYALVHRRSGPEGCPGGGATGPWEDAPVPAPVVPRHRIGPVVQALLLLERRHGPHELERRLRGLIETLDRLHGPASGEAEPRAERDQNSEARWWAARLLADVLLRLPDPRSQLGVLRLLADRITLLSVRSGDPGRLCGFQRFGSAFWEQLRIGESRRIDLLRRLVPADGAPGSPVRSGSPRYLDAVGRRLAADPRSVQPLLCRWFTDERPLPSVVHSELRPTVAGAAQALLYARRGLAVDDLAEALVATTHPRAEELLAALTEDEPSAMCRAVDRWAHDDRPERWVAAAAHIGPAAVHARTDGDRELLHYAARALLARPDDASLHGPALELLIRDPRTRERHLPRAMALYAAGHPTLPAAALAAALPTCPEAVRTVLVRDCADRRPDGAAQAAALIDHLLEQDLPDRVLPDPRAVLLPLVTGLLHGRPARVRGALAAVLAAPGRRCAQHLRDELLDLLLDYERYGAGVEARDDTSVPEALLRAAALGSGRRAEFRTRDLVHRTGLLMGRTPEGAARFDRQLVALCREMPGLAALVADWLAVAPQEWAVLVGPSTLRTVEKLGAHMPMHTAHV
ncbi:trypsin-like peptidase domain-containing protein [Streptomyces sp. NPDC051322]|uniref:trypsin-like peptidase domain-containing protein n=1 Tax=Streptomyces sp. NPDC051322 TaxID=3154645 RepID=UPI00344C40C7